MLTVRALQKNNFSNQAIVARAGKEALDDRFLASRSVFKRSPINLCDTLDAIHVHDE